MIQLPKLIQRSSSKPFLYQEKKIFFHQDTSYTFYLSDGYLCFQIPFLFIFLLCRSYFILLHFHLFPFPFTPIQPSPLKISFLLAYYLYSLFLCLISSSFCNILLCFFFDVDHFLKSLSNLLQYCFCFMFWFFGCKECGILAPQPGIEPTPSALESQVLTTGPPGKSLFLHHFGPTSTLVSVIPASGTITMWLFLLPYFFRVKAVNHAHYLHCSNPIYKVFQMGQQVLSVFLLL